MMKEGTYPLDHLEEAGEQLLFCSNCLCVPATVPALLLPAAGCLWSLCDCHTDYWASIPELEKRRLWGDR